MSVLPVAVMSDQSLHEPQVPDVWVRCWYCHLEIDDSLLDDTDAVSVAC